MDSGSKWNKNRVVSKQYTPLDNSPLGGLPRPIRTSIFQIVHLQSRIKQGQGQQYDSTTITSPKT